MQRGFFSEKDDFLRRNVSECFTFAAGDGIMLVNWYIMRNFSGEALWGATTPARRSGKKACPVVTPYTDQAVLTGFARNEENEDLLWKNLPKAYSFLR